LVLWMWAPLNPLAKRGGVARLCESASRQEREGDTGYQKRFHGELSSMRRRRNAEAGPA
jgi:hypothetical protein